VADNMATDQARLAVDTRAFPLLIYDPRKGNTIRERLSLQGNPAISEDWWTNPKTGEVVDFIDFARSEGRFGKHFDKDGNPSETLLRAKEDRLENWRLLQELAGVLKAGKKDGALSESFTKPAKPAAEKIAAAKAAIPTAAVPKAAVAKPAVSANGNGQKTNGKLPEGFSTGTRIKYNDGSGWVNGVIESLEPVVLAFEDDTIIRINHDVLAASVAEGLILKA
jgi:hypothetical protein